MFAVTALSVLSLLTVQTPKQPPVVVKPPARPHHSASIPILAPLKTPDYQPIAEAPLVAEPVAAPTTYPNTYEWGNCTWYVAGRKNVPDTWGNANTWAARAAADGYTVSSLPIVGAVAQSTAGYWGHVAIVTAVGDGQVLLSEMNVQGLGVVDERWVPVYDYTYIYV